MYRRYSYTNRRMNNHSEVRKVQTNAAGSFIITIPKDWATKSGLRKGDTISVEMEEEGSFRIVQKAGRPRTQQSHTKSFKVEDFPNEKLLSMCIVASYIQGHDITEITSNVPMRTEQKKWIRNAVEGLVGVEISEDYSDRVVLQNLIDPSKFEIDKVLLRFSAVSAAIYRDALRALTSGNFDLAADAFERGEESQKLYRLLMRQAIMAARSRSVREGMGLEDIGEVIVRALAVRELGRLSYYAMRIAQHVEELTGSKIPTDIMFDLTQIERLCFEMQSQAVEALLKKDLLTSAKVIDMMENVRQIHNHAVAIITKDGFEEKAVLSLHLLLRDLRAMAAYAVAIADDAVLGLFSD
jgi:phosphate uptake regulator